MYTECTERNKQMQNYLLKWGKISGNTWINLQHTQTHSGDITAYHVRYTPFHRGRRGRGRSEGGSSSGSAVCRLSVWLRRAEERERVVCSPWVLWLTRSLGRLWGWSFCGCQTRCGRKLHSKSFVSLVKCSWCGRYRYYRYHIEMISAIIDWTHFVSYPFFTVLHMGYFKAEGKNSCKFRKVKTNEREKKEFSQWQCRTVVEHTENNWIHLLFHCIVASLFWNNYRDLI